MPRFTLSRRAHLWMVFLAFPVGWGLFKASAAYRWHQRINRLQQLAQENQSQGELARLFLHPTKVEAFLVTKQEWYLEDIDKPAKLMPPDSVFMGHIQGLGYTDRRSDIAGDLGTRVGALTLDPEAKQGMRTLCGFNPAFAFRVWHNREWAFVAVCPYCSEYRLQASELPMPGQKSTPKPKFHFDTGGFFTGRIRSEFLALAHEALPNDKTLPASWPTF